jgi:molybdopterin synthase catalytic subunit
MTVRVQQEDFDLSVEVAAMRAGRPNVGAISLFVGTVRDVNQGTGVSTLALEHYPGMTERALQQIVDDARRRWTLDDIRVIHRVGELKPLDQIVLVAVTSMHRGEAIAACEFVIDWLKTQAPFWKKETTPEGARWVDAREADDAAAARWGQAPGSEHGSAS